MDHVIVIDEQGTVRTLYTDKIDLRDFGSLRVERASNVEWSEFHQGWVVQFSNSAMLGGMGRYLACPERGWCCGIHAVLGRKPEVFSTREEALAAEVEYLQARL